MATKKKTATADAPADALTETGPAKTFHAFAIGPDANCATCGWSDAEGDHIAVTDAMGATADAAGVKAKRASGARSQKAMALDNDAAPLTVEYHDNHPITGREARFGGKSLVTRMNNASREWWDAQRYGVEGRVIASYEVSGDGHSGVKDKDGYVTGMVAFKKLKVTAIEFDPPASAEDGLPIFEGQRVNMRRDVRAWAEAMESQLRKKDKALGQDGWRTTPADDLLRRAQGKFDELRQKYTDFASPETVNRLAADMANLAFMLAAVYAEGGTTARPVFAAVDDLCTCTDTWAVHAVDAPHKCEATREVTMGDGTIRTDACVCEGFRAAPVADTTPAPSALDQALADVLADVPAETAPANG